MANHLKIYSSIALVFIIACKDSAPLFNKNKIAETEKSFEKMVEEKGVAEAFYFFADKNAVINRENDSLVYGKESILKYYNNKRSNKKISLKWEPDFIEVSQNNDLAYTFGKYFYEVTDSVGKKTSYKGIFHTIWKKQPDGTWRYVWD